MVGPDETRASASASAVARIVAAVPVRAAGFIVTLYGDAVGPRGGEVWIGTIIEVCAAVGISETLVRTAVSRLVAAGQLQGRRRGRRSFYRLTDAARMEFDAAARLIYGPPDPVGWRFVYVPEPDAESRLARLEALGFARLRPQMAVGPARGALPREFLAFDAQTAAAEGLLPDFVAQLWDLAPHRRAYDGLLARFGPVLPHAAALSGADALTLRLLLVHDWRMALLRDPRLPASALPGDWPGHRARRLFAQLYLLLTPAAESRIMDRFEAAQGRLPATSPVADARFAQLREGDETLAGQ